MGCDYGGVEDVYGVEGRGGGVDGEGGGGAGGDGAGREGDGGECHVDRARDLVEEFDLERIR